MKHALWIIVVIILLGVVFFVFRGSPTAQNTSNTNEAGDTNQNLASDPAFPLPTNEGGSDLPAPQALPTEGDSPTTGNLPSTAPPQEPQTNPPAAPPVQTDPPAPEPPPIAPLLTPAVVTYTNSGFSPATIEIAVGESVTFVNESNSGMWVGSDFHPTHRLYPEKSESDCLGSSFDSCENIAPGASWEFIFNSVGSWKYHNHSSPGRRGTVVVHPVK